MEAVPAISRSVRGTLVAIAVGLAAVFGIAAWLQPYGPDGLPARMETHRQLGLPACTFYTVTGGLPCPSCGMTTSFALFVRGDLWHSAQANAVGTLLAAFCLALIPWNLACAVRGRLLLIGSIERWLLRVTIIFLVLLIGRWLVVLALHYAG